MIVLPSSSNRFYLTVLLLFVLSMPGCANVRGFLNESLPFPMHTADGIERNDFVVAEDVDVIGRLAMIRVEEG